MMKKKHERVKVLLDLFFEGQTSKKEEQELYRFFMQEHIPKELIKYQTVIQYFNQGIQDEVETSVPDITPQLNCSVRKQWMVWSSVAASFLILLCSSLLFLNKEKSGDPFEGSYIIRNGVRYTDLRQIRPELEAAVQNAMMQQQEIEQLIEQMTQPDHQVVTHVLLKTNEHYQQILNHISDIEIRNEVKKLIYNNF